MSNENFDFQDIISSLKKVLIEEYDNYENGNRNGTLIESEKFDGFIRIGKDLHSDQGEIAYMKNDGKSIVIRDFNCFVNIDGENNVLIKSIKLDSKEFDFINQTIEIGNAKTK